MMPPKCRVCDDTGRRFLAGVCLACYACPQGRKYLTDRLRLEINQMPEKRIGQAIEAACLLAGKTLWTISDAELVEAIEEYVDWVKGRR